MNAKATIEKHFEKYALEAEMTAVDMARYLYFVYQGQVIVDAYRMRDFLAKPPAHMRDEARAFLFQCATPQGNAAAKAVNSALHEYLTGEKRFSARFSAHEKNACDVDASLHRWGLQYQISREGDFATFSVFIRNEQDAKRFEKVAVSIRCYIIGCILPHFI